VAASIAIVVVGYDSDTSRILELWLSHLGYTVWVVDDPDRVLETALAVHAGLLITNYPTPLASGGTVLEAVRATPELDGTHVLNLTSRACSHELARASAVGASLSLPMPTSLHRIAREIARLVGAPGARVLDRAPVGS
jgi:CheY-like chemotaxis protein